jgi:hypothetical protein
MHKTSDLDVPFVMASSVRIVCIECNQFTCERPTRIRIEERTQRKQLVAYQLRIFVICQHAPCRNTLRDISDQAGNTANASGEIGAPSDECLDADCTILHSLVCLLAPLLSDKSRYEFRPVCHHALLCLVFDFVLGVSSIVIKVEHHLH